MQEVFLKLWLQRSGLTEIENPAAWLVRLSSNMSLSHLQRQAIHSKAVSKLSSQSPQTSISIEAEIDLKKIQAHIADAVNSLPEKRQQVYKLSREGGLNRKQIADRLGLSESTVKNQLSTALKHIQEHLEKNYGIYLPLFLLSSIIRS